MSADLSLILTTFIVLWSSYLMVSLSGLFSERSGVVNIGLNGIMIIGLMTYGSLMSIDSFNSLGLIAPFIAIVISGIVGILFNLLFAFAVVNFYTDQVISGTAMNLIAAAGSLLFIQGVFQRDILSWNMQASIELGGINLVYILFLVIALIVIIASLFVLNKTNFGLHLKSSGENPYALETSGISVFKTRYYALMISGFLAAIGGAMAAPAFSNTFNGNVNGMGYIAIAILIFGQWKIWGITLGSFIFSIISAIANQWLLFDLNFPVEFVKMIPFIVPLVVLIFIKSSNSPKMAGKPFKKDERV